MELKPSNLFFKLNTGIFLKVILLIGLLGSILNLHTITVFFIYLFFVLSLFKKRRSIKFYKYVIPLISMTFLGLIFSYTNLPKDVLRDFFYFTNPILLIIFGIICAVHFTLNNFVIKITYFGLFYSLYYIVSFTLLSFQDSYSLEEMRGLIGPGNIISILSFYFLISNQTKDKYSKILILRTLFICLNALAIILFNSRSYFICFIIFFLFFFQTFPLRIKFGLITFSIFVIVLLTTININSENSFYGKVLNTFDEISINNGADLSENNSNYRAFETLAAIDTYLSGNGLNYIIGQGFGKLVDLKIEIQLTTESWQFIPLVHNGYMYILVKTGLLGILFFFIFLFKFYPSKKFQRIPQKHLYIRVILKSLIISCILTNFVINGFFNLEMQFLLICLGAFFNYLKIENQSFTNLKFNNET
jgi:hypothetical protein